MNTHDWTEHSDEAEKRLRDRNLITKRSVLSDWEWERVIAEAQFIHTFCETKSS